MICLYRPRDPKLVISLKKEWVMKIKISLLFLIFCFGCATPPGKLTDEDFISKKISIKSKVPEALSLFWTGWRYCGSGWGVIECSPIKPDGSAVCDIYGPGLLGGRTDWVVGRVDFFPMGDGSEIILKIQAHILFLKEKRLGQWELLILDKAKEACP
jgi:hypothetical protein